MKKIWLIYAVLMISASVVSALADVAEGNQLPVLAPLGWVGTAMVCTAVIGYSTQTRMISASFWRTSFWIITAYTVLGLSYVLLKYRAEIDEARAALLAFALAVSVPAFVGMFRYAYSTTIWGQIPDKSLERTRE